MFHVVLYRPEIAPNTGNIIRLCANTGSRLHLIRPLGFELDDRRLRRAGLDYHEWAELRVYDELDACLDAFDPARVWPLTTHGSLAPQGAQFRADDVFVFGPETSGLGAALLDRWPAERRLRLPMLPSSRSLNLSNAVAVTIYEAWRQCGFRGAV
ncbi:MAG: tRNA (cytidine(34)-2'-O)-methyltransferase [Chromatiales bacterium]|nr:tRNA (cytidine(34)-2'-O)-methyltransferase [Chromatiales bacterium]